MSTYSDEPVLVKPTARGSWKLWLAIAAGLGIAGTAIYIPIEKNIMEERAHHAERGSRQGARYPLTLDGAAHTIELTWGPGGQFAPVLEPAPAPGVTLRLESRFGTETLAWSSGQGCFGPTTGAQADPFSHYKLSLRLERDGRALWSDTLWAYGIHDSHGHSH